MCICFLKQQWLCVAFVYNRGQREKCKPGDVDFCVQYKSEQQSDMGQIKVKPSSIVAIITVIVTLILIKIIFFNSCASLNVWNTNDLELVTSDVEPKIYGDMEDINKIVRTAKKMMTQPVMISLVNDAFLSFVLSWLCNTKHMDIHHKVLLITTDSNTKEKITFHWPDINVAVISVDKSLHGAQTYSQAGYIRLVIRRTQILLALLDNNIETFMFEVDCLWINNSVPLLHSHNGEYDMVFHGISGKAEKINGGFLYLFPTAPTKSVFKALNMILLRMDKKLQELPPGQCISERENDQEFLSKLVYMQYAGAKSKVFPLTTFGDGKWYSLPEVDRQSYKPYLINFNWIVGNKNKILRAKEWGHWFIKEDGMCDNDRVLKTLKSM